MTIKAPVEWVKGFTEGFLKNAQGNYDTQDAQYASETYFEDEYDESQQTSMSCFSASELYSKGFTAGKNEVTKWLSEDEKEG